MIEVYAAEFQLRVQPELDLANCLHVHRGFGEIMTTMSSVSSVSSVSSMGALGVLLPPPEELHRSANEYSDLPRFSTEQSTSFLDPVLVWTTSFRGAWV